MRTRGISHVELTVPDYEAAIAFYDRMFGWLGYKSFWTLDVEYRSTYYVSGLLPHFPHSYIGIQPAKDEGGTSVQARYAPGLNHLALAARSKREVRQFYEEFLQPEGIEVVDAPAAYPHYGLGYYAVFFRDPPLKATWELVYMPLIPSPRDWLDTYRAWKQIKEEHRKEDPQGKSIRVRDAPRQLPSRKSR